MDLLIGRSSEPPRDDENAGPRVTLLETTMDAAAANIEAERHTYGEWQALGRQVKKGQRRGADGRFAHSQTKGSRAIGGRLRCCLGCGCRINYGLYCGKCEFGR